MGRGDTVRFGKTAEFGYGEQAAAGSRRWEVALFRKRGPIRILPQLLKGVPSAVRALLDGVSALTSWLRRLRD
jgi:hypothetical protein